MDEYLSNLPLKIKQELLEFIPNYDQTSDHEKAKELFEFVSEHKHVAKARNYRIKSTDHVEEGLYITVIPIHNTSLRDSRVSIKVINEANTIRGFTGHRMYGEQFSYLLVV